MILAHWIPKAAILWAVVVLASLLVIACSGGGEMDGGPSAGGQSDAFRQGEDLFGANCSICHGAIGDGTPAGPPLVHAIYNPNHHPDFAFHNAVNNGVPQHHWVFGDMAPRPGLSEGDVNNIICYIRQLQVDEGIYEGEAPC